MIIWRREYVSWHYSVIEIIDITQAAPKIWGCLYVVRIQREPNLLKDKSFPSIKVGLVGTKGALSDEPSDDPWVFVCAISLIYENYHQQIVSKDKTRTTVQGHYYFRIWVETEFDIVVYQ